MNAFEKWEKAADELKDILNGLTKIQRPPPGSFLTTKCRDEYERLFRIELEIQEITSESRVLRQVSPEKLKDFFLTKVLSTSVFSEIQDLLKKISADFMFKRAKETTPDYVQNFSQFSEKLDSWLTKLCSFLE